jgi:hypothetical protein
LEKESKEFPAGMGGQVSGLAFEIEDKVVS